MKWHNKNKDVEALLNEWQGLADECNLRKNNLDKDEFTRAKAESAEAVYLYCIQRLLWEIG